MNCCTKRNSCYSTEHSCAKDIRGCQKMVSHLASDNRVHWLSLGLSVSVVGWLLYLLAEAEPCLLRHKGEKLGCCAVGA